MICLFRGPGGPLRRLTSECVPFCVGIAAAGCALPFLGLPAAIAAGLVAWIGCSTVLSAVRGRPRLRTLYRVALAAHVTFWTFLGVSATVPQDESSREVLGAHAWSERTAFRAGYGAADYTLPPHATLAGWGTRPRRANFPPFAGLGVLGRLGMGWMGAACDTDDGPRVPLFHRPSPETAAQRLGARAVVLRPDGGGAPLAILRLDLVTCDTDLTREIRAGVADLGFVPETVIVAATHTHSGPGGYSRQAFSTVAGTDHFDAASFRAVCDAGIAAVRAAFTSARPASIALIRSHDRDPDGGSLLARHRRDDASEGIDDRVYGLHVAESGGGPAIAVVLNYAVHPVVFRRRHMGFHRDLAGAVEEAVADRFEGRPPVLFLNGAVAYATSHAVPGTSQQRADTLAARFAERVVADHEVARHGERLRVRSSRVALTFGDPSLVIASSDRAGFIDAYGGALWSGGAGALAAKAIALPLNAIVWSMGMPELRVGFRWNGSVGAVVNLEDFVDRRTFEVGAVTFEVGDGDAWALLWTPGEATYALGRGWRERAAARGYDDAMLVGFAGGSTAYVTTPDEYREDTYEARGTLFGANAGEFLGQALEEALDAVANLR